ncbi:hypothetical protein ABZV29_27630 [Streptomyces sp. NPDC005236]|uniref:hypothetical protein n=1 Tax=Streptomyces sp. NPDC005236 TaxID=3157028 RepID=UPI0033BC0753
MAAVTNWQGFERDKKAERLMALHAPYWEAATARDIERAAEAPSPVQENAMYAQDIGLGRQGAPGANQLSRADLRNMPHQEIMQARKDGLLDGLMKGL